MKLNKITLNYIKLFNSIILIVYMFLDFLGFFGIFNYIYILNIFF
jgi:hypothetical protein